MLVVIGNTKLDDAIARAIKSAQQDAADNASSLLDRVKTAADLEKKIADMEIAQAKKQEAWDRREREVEHKVGLERKRQEFEIEQAKRDTQVTVREENLKAEKERFKSEMDFQRKRLEEEVGSLRELVQKMLERLPSAEIYADLSAGKKAR